MAEGFINGPGSGHQILFHDNYILQVNQRNHQEFSSVSRPLNKKCRSSLVPLLCWQLLPQVSGSNNIHEITAPELAFYSSYTPATALQVTSPSRGDKLDLTSSNEVTWDSVE